MEKEIDKLGTVLAVSNQINRDMLDMLKEQQKRQVRMIWSSIGIMAMAVVVCGLSVYMTLSSVNKLTEQVNRNTEVLHYVDDEDAIIVPGQLNRVVLSEDATRSDIMKEWRRWEMDTKAMYLRLIEDNPECRLWVKLYKGALHEITCIDYLM